MSSVGGSLVVVGVSCVAVYHGFFMLWFLLGVCRYLASSAPWTFQLRRWWISMVREQVCYVLYQVRRARDISTPFVTFSFAVLFTGILFRVYETIYLRKEFFPSFLNMPRWSHTHTHTHTLSLCVYLCVYANKGISVSNALALGLSSCVFHICEFLRSGNPLEVSGVVQYFFEHTKRAAFQAVNADQLVKDQSSAVLKRIVSQFPYEAPDGELSLKTEAATIGEQYCEALQKKVDVAGVRVLSFSFNELSYAPEVAASMLKRQQAGAFLQAKELIVEGALGIVL